MLQKGISLVVRMLIIVFALLILLQASSIFSGGGFFIGLCVIIVSAYCVKLLLKVDTLLSKKTSVKLRKVERLSKQENCA